MLNERWDELKQLVDSALDRPVAERQRWLERQTATDPELAAEASAILAADERAGGFLEASALDAGLALLSDHARTVEPGARIGPYEVVRSLGAGGMGQVLLAVRADESYRQRVAIKLVDRAANAASLRRFRQERQILADLEHPYVARLYDGGATQAGWPYLVMEHVEGEPIDRYATRHQLSLRGRLELFRKVLSAVAFAHRSLVIHLDLKPANILVRADGEPKLLDFGIARLLRRDAVGETTLGQRPMTLDYASPEQLRGERLTTASDVYSLGVVLYRLLTGSVPHARGDGPALDLATEPPPEPPSRRCDRRRWVNRLAGDLDAIVLKALRREPDARYRSVEQLDDDLGRYLDGLPVQARRGSWRYRLSRFARRHWLVLTLATALVLALVTFTAIVSLQARHVAAERDHATRARFEAEEVGTFLAELLGRFDPGAVDGIRITVPELLDRGAMVLDETVGSSSPTGRLESPVVRARLLATLGSAYRAWGRYEDAERLLEESLAIRQALYGTAHPEVAESLNALGELARNLSDYGAAEERHRQALAIVEAQPGGDPLGEAATRQRLGRVLFEQSDPAGARANLERACTVRRQLQGDHHMETARCLLIRADIEAQAGDPIAAERLAMESVRILEQLRPDGHPDLADAWAVVAHARLERKAKQEAGQPLEKVLAIRRRTLPVGHLEISAALNDLAAWHIDAGSPQQAEGLLHESLEIIRLHFGDDSERAALAFYSLGVAQHRQDRGVDAEASWRRSVEILRRVLPEGRPLLFPLKMLAERCIEQGRGAEARALAEEALAHARKAYPAGHRQITKMEGILARARAVEPVSGRR
ncbi:MAG: serine/threonine-protein kinase [Acidobacteriota bacterium]